jgi:hypothetical protein
MSDTALDQEMAAMGSCVRALEKLSDPKQQQRVIEYLEKRYGPDLIDQLNKVNAAMDERIAEARALKIARPA